MTAKRRELVFLGFLALAVAGGGKAASQPKEKLSPESAQFYQAARLIMSREEEKIFKHLTDEESRKEFIKDFWDKRDPDPDSDVNEFKTEFENRVAYANKHFREGGLGMNSDRGRIYIFMGPPDKFEESFTHADTSVRGPYLWWIYYKYGLLIQFVDEKNIGLYKIANYEGDFFEAMNLFRLGQWVGPNSVFKKSAVNFGLQYDAPSKTLNINIPAKTLLFKENEEGKLEVALEFKFYIYENEGATKETVTEQKTFVTTDKDLEGLKDIPFGFARSLKRGKNFVDVIIKGREGTSGKVRKIFEINVKS